jgi:glutaredoxin
MIDFKKVDGKDVGDIKMFALSTCGWCKKTKAFLSDHGIAYSYVDVDLLEGGEMDEA